MAAKTAGTWAPYNEVGIADLTNIDTTAAYTLGKRCMAIDRGSTGYGFAEFIYLSGVASTARGSVVLISGAYGTTLVVARDKGGLGVALAAVTAATSFGWYQIKGTGVALCDSSVTNDAPLYIDGTAGRVDDTVVAGDLVIGMRAASTDDTNTCLVTMSVNPAVGDFDNA